MKQRVAKRSNYNNWRTTANTKASVYRCKIHNRLQDSFDFSGIYNSENATIQAFWQVLREFSETQKRQLLKFVTSCSRPPLLGFKVK